MFQQIAAMAVEELPLIIEAAGNYIVDHAAEIVSKSGTALENPEAAVATLRVQLAIMGPEMAMVLGKQIQFASSGQSANTMSYATAGMIVGIGLSLAIGAEFALPIYGVGFAVAEACGVAAQAPIFAQAIAIGVQTAAYAGGNYAGKDLTILLHNVFEAVPSWLSNSSAILHKATVDPLVINLSPGPASITPLSPSSPYFDLSASGIAQKTSWLSGNSAFLVLSDANGQVLNGSQIIKDISQLKSLTADGSGRISSGDGAYSTVQVWQDINQNGICDPGELFTLADLGIESIQVLSPDANGYVAKAEMSDGSVDYIQAIDLRTSNTFTGVQTPFLNQLPPDDALLPDLQGYGTLPNLQISMGEDPTLAGLVALLVSADSNDASSYDSLLESVLLRWAKVDDTQAGTNPNVDMRKIGFLESLFGNDARFGPSASMIPNHQSQVSLVQESWSQAFNAMKARLLIQDPSSLISSDFYINPISNTIMPTKSFNDIMLDIASGAQSLSGDAEENYWLNALLVINDSASDVNKLAPDYSLSSEITLRESAPSYIDQRLIHAAVLGKAILSSTESSQGALYVPNENGLVVVDTPNATIVAISSFIECIIATNEGMTSIYVQDPSESGGIKVVLPSNAVMSAISVSSDESADLIIAYGTNGVVALKSFLTGAPGGVTILLQDGTEISGQQLISMEMNPLLNSSGAIYGTGGPDLLDGQGIDKYLGGNGGGDTFIYNIGYHSLEIAENDGAKMSADVLQIGAGITASDVVATSNVQGDLILEIADGRDDSIELDRMLASTDWGIGSIRLSDGTVITREQLITMADTGSTQNAQINSLLPGAQIDPAGFAHAVTSNGGNSDIYYCPGYGALEINERDPVLTDANTLRFGPGISPASVQVSTDDLGNIVLNTGNSGDTITLDAMALGPNNGVQRISFYDGTVWTAQQVVSQLFSSATSYYGTISFDKGQGAFQASGMGIAGVQLGASVQVGDVYEQTDAAGDLVLRLRSDPADSLTLTNDIYETSGLLSGAVSSVHQVFYSDGTFIDLTQGLNFTWIGTSSAHTLVGSNFANINEFDIGTGGDSITAGNSSGGGSGENIFTFARGDGRAVVNMNGGSGIVRLDAGIEQSDVSLQSDQAGNLMVVIDDTGDSLTIKGGLVQTAWGVSSPIKDIQFADGTSLPVALTNFTPQSLTYSWVGMGDGTTLVGSPWGANRFIVGPGNANIVAGNGSMTGGQAGSAENTFYFDQGDGHAVVNMNGGYGQVVLAADIAPYEVMLQSNAVGDLTLALQDDPDDSITFQGDLTGQAWQNASSRIGQVSFSDGSSISLGVTGLGQYSPITFTWVGTATSTALVGSNFGANVFDLGPDGDTVTAGDGSQGGSNANTFLFGRGDGNAVVTLNGGAGTLQLDASIMRSDVRFAANAQGDITVSIKGDTTDSITFLSDVYYTPFGPGSRLGAIQYGDGTTQQLGIHSYQSFMPTFTEIGTATSTVLIGSNYGDNSFEFGPAAPDGSGDTVISGNPSQGGSGYNTFKLALGSGHVHVTLGGGYGVLQLGAGLSASDMLLETNPQGDVTFAFASDSTDSVTFDGDLYNRPFGPVSAINQVQSADGSSTPIGVIGYTDHPMTFTSIGTADNTLLTGSGFGANVFDFGLSDSHGFGDMVTAGNGSQGGSGFNTFNYGVGDGNAVVNMNGGWGVLNLGGNIILADLVFQADAQGNMTVSIAGNTQDTIKFNGDLSTGPYGTVSAVNKVAFSDGSSQVLDSAYWQAHPSGYA